MSDYAELKVELRQRAVAAIEDPQVWWKLVNLASPQNILAVLDEIGRLEAALRFYAEDDSYYSSKAADGGYDIPVLLDSGWKAKEALGE